jgi:hypothetical protein
VAAGAPHHAPARLRDPAARRGARALPGREPRRAHRPRHLLQHLVRRGRGQGLRRRRLGAAHDGRHRHRGLRRHRVGAGAVRASLPGLAGGRRHARRVRVLPAARAPTRCGSTATCA